MDHSHDLHWFAIQTKPYQERLAAARVAKLDVEIFLPRTRQEQSVCGSLRTVCKALFPGYFFACFCPFLSLDAVRYASGVLRVVGNSRFPIPLEPDIIASIRALVQSDGFIRLKTKRFIIGDKVTIDRGPFAGWIGRVEREGDEGKRVLILLDAIQQARLLVENRSLATAERV